MLDSAKQTQNRKDEVRESGKLANGVHNDIFIKQATQHTKQNSRIKQKQREKASKCKALT